MLKSFCWRIFFNKRTSFLIWHQFFSLTTFINDKTIFNGLKKLLWPSFLGHAQGNEHALSGGLTMCQVVSMLGSVVCQALAHPREWLSFFCSVSSIGHIGSSARQTKTWLGLVVCQSLTCYVWRQQCVKPQAC